jgi:hypothetical protein
MMTLESVRLSAPLQALIDARLDTIDRMLLGVVPREDRLAIVRDVESQVHELLQARNTDEPSRADVLSVLASLDPPEAYLPDEQVGETPTAPRPMPLIRPSASQPGPSDSNMARVSGVLGIVSLLGALILPSLSYLVAVAFSSIEVLIAAGACSVGLVVIGCVLAVVLASRAGLKSGWAVAGLVTGLLSVPLALGLLGLSFLLG